MDALVISQNTANDNRGNGLGIILHNDSNTDTHYGPVSVGWGTKSLPILIAQCMRIL